jgi:inorganic pyrophosphatase
MSLRRSPARKPDLTGYLGKQVVVRIDRTLGSRHPRHADIYYPINYGELADTVSGDGHPVDAYVMGAERPLREVTGVVVAVLVREDDVEDKLVVLVGGGNPSAEAIWEQVRFQEQHFETRLVLSPGISGNT